MNNWNQEKKRLSKQLLSKKIIVTILLLLETMSVIGIAYTTQSFINDITVQKKSLFSLIMVLICLFFQSILLFVANKSFNDLGTQAREAVRNYTFKNTIHNDALIYKIQTGDLLSRISSDAGDVGERIGQRSVLLYAGIIQTIIVLALLFYLDWIVAICVICIYPIYFGITGVINKKIQKRLISVREKQANSQHVLLKGLQGFLDLTVLRKQKYYSEIYAKTLKNTSNQFYHYNTLTAINLMLRNLICTVLPVIAIIISTFSSVFSNNTIFIYILAGYLVQPLNSLSNLFQYIHEDKALEKRFLEVLTIQDIESKEPIVYTNDNKLDVHINKYCLGNKELLYNCKFSVEQGQLMFIKGASGCGKSTLLKLIIKQLPFNEEQGEILINGRSICSIDKESLYEYIGYVNQTYFIFEDTLENNLCMGDMHSVEEIRRVIDMCGLSDFVMQYGLNYVISEDGKNISQGQLQRICIARILLKNPKCLLLDEPTSSLDEQTAKNLMTNILRYVKENNIIAICVTHNDEVIVNECNVIELQ